VTQFDRKIPCFHGAHTVNYGKNTVLLEKTQGEITPIGLDARPKVHLPSAPWIWYTL